jgi:septal ring factor EnvC (AmiA/AmiB activator)
MNVWPKLQLPELPPEDINDTWIGFYLKIGRVIKPFKNQVIVEMKFLLKRRLNPFLLLTTVLGLSLLVGLSIVFQTQFEDIAGDREELQAEIEGLNSKINALEQNNTRLVEQNSRLENETSELEKQINSIESQESDLESEVERLNNRTEQLQQERNRLREERDDMQRSIRDICQLETIENTGYICDDYVDNWSNEN